MTLTIYCDANPDYRNSKWKKMEYLIHVIAIRQSFTFVVKWKKINRVVMKNKECIISGNQRKIQ